MIPVLTALIALQQLDSTADAARRRLHDLPGEEQTIEATVATASGAVEAAKHLAQENLHARRLLEKEVAAVDTRLARFDDHKAAVKTNQEYTALLHEIATARGEKDAIEERILELMEGADGISREQKDAEAALAKARREGDEARAALGRERGRLEAEVRTLAAQRTGEATAIDARTLATYDQLVKNRRGVAVAAVEDGHCTACHVRLRPATEQVIRRNEIIVQCDSCQRILYFAGAATAAAATT